MINKNYSAIVDFGKSKFRLGVFTEDLNILYSCSKDINKNYSVDEKTKILNFIIKEAEKKISNHLENIIVLYDSPKINSVDISVKKTFDQKIFFKDIQSSIILEANELIKNNYINKKIIHIITKKNILDGKEFPMNFNDNLKLNSVILELKFILLPKDEYDEIVKIVKKNNLQILNFFCTSYVKSCHYINSFSNYEFITFLDIGWEKTILTSFNKNKLEILNSIPLGGNHITKDISKVLKIDLYESESIKKALNKSEIDFSYDNNLNNNNDILVKELINKNISVDLLKKVVLARIQEIIELVFKDIKFSESFKSTSNSILVLVGNGSKFLHKNSFHLDNVFNLKEITFYDESDLNICKAGIEFNQSRTEIKMIKKNNKKPGIFEKFFNFFGK
tara:strand:- start:719 stop:1894 length:1176 start_codon:yes stop_codon:yes gene_type:complete